MPTLRDPVPRPHWPTERERLLLTADEQAEYETLSQMGDEDYERWSCQESLLTFFRRAWREIDPAPFEQNWHHQVICEQLESLARGEVRDIVINIPPRCGKSNLVAVIFPAWMWIQDWQADTPLMGPHCSFLCVSYGAGLAEVAAVKMRRLISGEWYQRLWGDKVRLREDQASRADFGIYAGGERISNSIEGGILGRGGLIQIIDDPHKIDEVESDSERERTLRALSEGLTTRITDPRISARILVMQRLHQADATDYALRQWRDDLVHVMLPMRFNPDFACPLDRRSKQGELLWPDVWNEEAVSREERELGPYAASGQLQQVPVPRGGGIIKSEWLEAWPPSNPDGSFPQDMVMNGRIQYPALEYVVACVDTAFTTKQTNDRSAMVVLGVFRAEGKGRIEMRSDGTFARVADDYGYPKILLLYGWAKRLELHGPPADAPPPDVDISDWNDPIARRRREALNWGLVETVVDTCKRYKVDHLRILTLGQGHGLEQEIRRLHADVSWGVEMEPERGDKIARAYAVQHIFSSRQFFAPMFEDGTRPSWAGPIIEELCVPGETEIVTKYGLRRISEIEPGELVLTHKGRFRPVLAVGKRSADRLVTLKAKTLDPLRLTPEHPVYSVLVGRKRDVDSPEWRRSDEIVARRYREVNREGGKRRPWEATDDPAHALLIPVPQRECPIDSIDLKEWAKLPTGRRYEFHSDTERMWTSSGRIKAVIWHQPLDADFGKLCGLYLAEGSTRRAQTSWSFNEKETDLHDFVRGFLRDRMGVGSFLKPGAGGITVVTTLPLLEDFFAEFGKGAREKRIPEWVWDAPDAFVSALIEGYADGDGYRREEGRLVICTTISKSLAWGIRLLCARVGLRATIRRNEQKPGKTINGVEIKTTQPFYYVSWITKHRRGPAHIDVGTDLIGYSVMKKSTQEAEEDVFNLHVAEDESYFTTGGIVHNCVFPRGRHDDFVDAMTGALRHLRETGIFERREEFAKAETAAITWRPSRGTGMPYELAIAGLMLLPTLALLFAQNVL